MCRYVFTCRCSVQQHDGLVHNVGIKEGYPLSRGTSENSQVSHKQGLEIPDPGQHDDSIVTRP